MADKDLSPKLAALRSLEASLHRHRRAEAARRYAERGDDFPRRQASKWRDVRRRTPWLRNVFVVAAGLWAMLAAGFRAVDRFGLLRRMHRCIQRFNGRPAVRRTARGLAVAAIVFAIAIGGLWWRLTAGSISLDFATPWLSAAVAENLGQRYQAEIGGTVIELDENRRIAIRMRDVVLREGDGTVVARAPKAEAGFSLWALLSGRPRIERLNLVGAEIALRVEHDGTVAVFAGAEKRPLTTSPVIASADTRAPVTVATDLDPTAATAVAAAAPGFGAGFATFLAWLDNLASRGLDGGALAEIGLKSGNLIVEDSRNGRQSRFENIHLGITRPNPGELSVTLGSQDAGRPWVLVAAIKPTQAGSRAVRLEARQVLIRDALLAARFDAGDLDTDLAVSASLRAEVLANGVPAFANGRVVVGPGGIGTGGDAEGRVQVERFESTFEWNAARRTMVAPFQLIAKNTRMTLIASAEAPAEPGGAWSLGVRGGSVVVASDRADEDAMLLKRVVFRSRLDPASSRLDIQDAEIAGEDVNIAASGFVDFSTADPRLVIGMAARNMSGDSFKRIWPPFVNPKVRAWVLENMSGGTVQRAEVATNAPLSTLQDGGPPVPDDGLSIEVASKGTVVRLIDDLPPVKETDIAMQVRGRHAMVTMGRGVVELPSGRRLAIANGVFDVADTQQKNPPANIRARIDGPVPAAAELLAMDKLRQAASSPLDPATSKGMVSAQVAVGMRLEPDAESKSLAYTIAADVKDFAVERFVMGQKVEASLLRIMASRDGYQFKGDVKIGGTPAVVEYRKAREDTAAEVRLQAVFDEAARNRFGFDSKGGVAGPIQVKLNGRLGGDAEESRLGVELDLTDAKVDNLLPGWVKNAGKAAHASFTYVAADHATHVSEITIEGAGAAIKGDLELDDKGSLVTASFPNFALSDGDKANLKAERGADGLIKVTMRGEVFDGRAFVKSVMGGSSAETKQRRAMADFDLDLKVNTLAGFHSETLRGADLKLVSRAGRFEAFSLAGKMGDQALQGDLRERSAAEGGGQVIYFESKDAGALFRFTDIYPRMYGGQVWVAMDPPGPETTPRAGLLNVRNFSVRGEAALDRVASGAPGQENQGIAFERMRVDFTREPGRLTIREGVVRGPVIGATIEGAINYARNEVSMRGTFVPLYGLNNAFGQIPIVGMLLSGGSNEGLVGVTFQVVGTPSSPVLNVNPISALTPGVLRKFFEFPNTGQTSAPNSAIQ